MGIVLGGVFVPASVATGLQGPAGRPLTVAELWLNPLPDAAVDAGFSRALTDLAENRALRALEGFAALAGDAVLGGYARLHIGRSELALERPAAAAATARQLLDRRPQGALA